MKFLSEKITEDWTILKYGWLAVFIIHICYLFMGNQWLKSALALTGPLLETPPQVRVTLALTSARMIVIGFSSILLMMTVFIYEIFKMVKSMKVELVELRENLGSPALNNLKAKEIEGSSTEDELADEPELF